MIYLDRKLWLWSPSRNHERIKNRLGQLVTEILVALRMPHSATSQTTFRRKGRRGGVEGDQTYYIANERSVRGKEKINLRVDPPPDLAIEAVHSHDAAPSVEVYRRLRVPEVWVCDDDELQILVRQANGRYAEAPSSLAFPFLSAIEVLGWVKRVEDVSDLEWIEAMRAWVHSELLPRTKRGPSGSAEREK
jgi:Uma2 family endonuclease